MHWLWEKCKLATFPNSYPLLTCLLSLKARLSFVDKKPISQAENFYAEVLRLLSKKKLEFMLAGTYAFRQYTGIHRPTKDLDIFCRAGDYPKILQALQDEGYKTEITDARWIAKAKKKNHYIDIIFGSASGQCLVDDTWFEHAKEMHLFGIKIKAIAPEEFLWSKTYVQDRARFEGPDVHHMILTQGKTLDWKRLLSRMDPHWEILLAHLINFRFIYPSVRDIIPTWLLKELLNRVQQQFSIPTPKDKICRGTMLSRTHYQIDIAEWGYKDVT